MALSSFAVPKNKTEVVACPALGGDVIVSSLTVADAIRLQGLMAPKEGEELSFTRMIAASLMCSMKTEEGTYLVEDDSRLDEVSTLDNSTAQDLYGAYLRLNPVDTDDLDTKKK